MHIKRSLLVASTVAAVTLGGGGLAIAATGGSSTSGNSLVDKIAARFNLNKSDVQAVFDQNRADQDAKRQANQKDRLAQAVKDGQLTQAQADHITAALAEIDQLRGTSKPGDLSADTRAQIKSKMDALRQWASDNKVNTKFLMLSHDRRFGRHAAGGASANTNANTNTSTNSNNTTSTSGTTDSTTSSGTIE